MKICKKCLKEKSIDDFYFYTSKNFRDGMCKTCRNKNNRNWRTNNLKSNFYLREKLVQQKTNICHVCGEIKDLSEFYKTKHVKSGYHNTCKTCCKIRDKNQKLKSTYGITLQNLYDMLAYQNGKCAVCKKEIVLGEREVCVDHDHTTKKIRGLLCNSCNRSIGMLQDNIEILESAITYLKLAQDKSDKLLENPEEDNQQPIITLNE